MKRYRVIDVTFDTRATILGLDVRPEWEDDVRNQWFANQERVREGLQRQFGPLDWARKERDLLELGPLPFSVVGFHNQFLRQACDAFLVGAYYPALTAATCLGERILNHLVLRLRDHFPAEAKTDAVRDKKSIANWKAAITALDTWRVLTPGVKPAFERLGQLRHRSVHFNASLEKDVRAPALEAMKLIMNIVSEQFAALGPQPWFIPNAMGLAFIRRDAEVLPFVREFYLPSCRLVGPDHELEPTPSGSWSVVDHTPHDATSPLTDEAYLAAFESAKAARVLASRTT